MQITSFKKNRSNMTVPAMGNVNGTSAYLDTE